MLAALVFIGIALTFMSQALRRSAPELLALFDTYPLPALAAVATLAGLASLHQRRRLRADFSSSWLAALPITAHVRDRAFALRVLIPIVAVVIGAAFVLAIAARLTHPASGDGWLPGLFVGAGMIGASVGWLLGARDPRPPRLRAPRLPSRTTRVVPGLAALGRWPLAQALAGSSPALHARALGALLLTIPIGVPGHVCMLLIVLWATALVLVEVGRGLLVTIPAAAAWLHSTPLTLPVLARSLCAPAFGIQIAAALTAAIVLIVLGVQPPVAGLLAAFWLSIVISLIGIALTCRHRPQHMHRELLVVGTIGLLLVSTAPPLLAIAFPFFWLWQWRRAKQA